MINNLTLEELISLKLELSRKHAEIPFFGFPVFKSIKYIVEEAVIRYAYVNIEQEHLAASFLGLTLDKFYQKFFKYKVHEYFKYYKEKIELARQKKKEFDY